MTQIINFQAAKSLEFHSQEIAEIVLGDFAMSNPNLFIFLAEIINSTSQKSIMMLANLYRLIKPWADQFKVDICITNLSEFDRIFVIGAGKSSSAMGFELEKVLGRIISNGIIITNYGNKTDCNNIRVFEAGHPLVDNNSILYTKVIKELTETMNENDLVIFLLIIARPPCVHSI